MKADRIKSHLHKCKLCDNLILDKDKITVCKILGSEIAYPDQYLDCEDYKSKRKKK